MEAYVMTERKTKRDKREAARQKVKAAEKKWSEGKITKEAYLAEVEKYEATKPDHRR
jgi:hypothetical protein